MAITLYCLWMQVTLDTSFVESFLFKQQNLSSFILIVSSKVGKFPFPMPGSATARGI